jgi:uncharacterized membrane protein YjgN (DUF898 family)
MNGRPPAAGRLEDGGVCHHEGETSAQCARCSTNLHDGQPAADGEGPAAGGAAQEQDEPSERDGEDRDTPRRPNPTAAMLRRCAACRSVNPPTNPHCVHCGCELVPRAASVHVDDRLTLDARQLPLAFSGSATEYFRIWIVNTCLTLLSAGVFSAWAKVRKKRYLYSHTTLGGTPFQYLGQPIPILRGRLIAAALFAVYYVSSHFVRPLLPYVLVAGVLLAPWVIVRSGAFNARYSAFRNMTFRFDATYIDALAVLPSWGLLPSFVVVTLFDWGRALGLAVVIFGVVYPYWLRQRKSFFVRHVSFGGVKGVFSARSRQFFRIYLVAVLIFIPAAAASVWLIRQGHPIHPQASALLRVIPIYAAWVLAGAYVRARTTNLVWEHTRLGPLRFRSTLPAAGMVWLYLTNTIAIIVSAGLLTPWAVLRTLKFRTDHMQVLVDGELAAFHGDQRATIAAAGAELGEFFELDLAL